MAYIVLVIGVALVSISLWEVKRLREESVNDLENIQLLKKEVYQAKSDVENLIKELDKASERAVHEFAHKIQESREFTEALKTSAKEETAAAEAEDEDEELKGQIAIEFTVEPFKIPEKHKIVYQLAEKGLTPGEIAQKTKMGKGEVILILNLRNRSEDKDVQVLQ